MRKVAYCKQNKKRYQVFMSPKLMIQIRVQKSTFPFYVRTKIRHESNTVNRPGFL